MNNIHLELKATIVRCYDEQKEIRKRYCIVNHPPIIIIQEIRNQVAFEIETYKHKTI